MNLHKAIVCHLKVASGLAGVAKCLRMLQHGTISARITLMTLSPRITPLSQERCSTTSEFQIQMEAKVQAEFDAVIGRKAQR
ncbi:hypothetical protein CY34DRAFT_801352 [Suillus luteus UH-Slu-Lm8-n1]|uniref:Uncharacterized protein n=1 Tax=Suillus luteus UH-Slu-Lm8-n1 TaxID=930992 RepID=A0A0D0BHN8_9AGAM|nr:hypothetical protein CY34DRAFT_801352 [Suillus luteus UH-Slu-Lm8-n1]